MVMGHLVPQSGAGNTEFTCTDIATTCTWKVTELDLSAPEQLIWELAVIFKRALTKATQMPAAMLWMIPTYSGWQGFFDATLSNTHMDKRAAISQGMASHRSSIRSTLVSLDAELWLCGGEGSEVTHYKPCF